MKMIHSRDIQREAKIWEKLMSTAAVVGGTVMRQGFQTEQYRGRGSTPEQILNLLMEEFCTAALWTRPCPKVSPER